MLAMFSTSTMISGTQSQLIRSRTSSSAFDGVAMISTRAFPIPYLLLMYPFSQWIIGVSDASMSYAIYHRQCGSSWSRRSLLGQPLATCGLGLFQSTRDLAS
jgi:hypothetical protein